MTNQQLRELAREFLDSLRNTPGNEWFGSDRYISSTILFGSGEDEFEGFLQWLDRKTTVCDATKTVTVPDLSDLMGQAFTPEIEAEIRRRLESVGLEYGGVLPDDESMEIEDTEPSCEHKYPETKCDDYSCAQWCEECGAYKDGSEPWRLPLIRQNNQSAEPSAVPIGSRREGTEPAGDGVTDDTAALQRALNKKASFEDRLRAIPHEIGNWRLVFRWEEPYAGNPAGWRAGYYIPKSCFIWGAPFQSLEEAISHCEKRASELRREALQRDGLRLGAPYPKLGRWDGP